MLWVEIITGLTVLSVAIVSLAGTVSCVAFIQARKLAEGHAASLCQVVAQADERIRAQQRRLNSVEDKLWAHGNANALLAHQQALSLLPQPEPVPDHALANGEQAPPGTNGISPEHYAAYQDLLNTKKRMEASRMAELNRDEDGFDREFQ